MLFCFLCIIILALGNGNLSQDAVHSPTTGSTPKLSAVAKRTNLGFASSNPGTPRVSPHGTPKSQESHNSHTSGGQYSCMTLCKICILDLSPPQRFKRSLYKTAGGASQKGRSGGEPLRDVRQFLVHPCRFLVHR